jgi:hypothetical protein
MKTRALQDKQRGVVARLRALARFICTRFSRVFDVVNERLSAAFSSSSAGYLVVSDDVASVLAR